MSKKDFKGGLSTILGEGSATAEEVQTSDGKKGRGRPKTSTKVALNSSEKGTKENETRATFIVRKDLLESLKIVAYWERLQIKDATNEALEEYIQRYERKNGPLKPIPKK